MRRLSCLLVCLISLSLTHCAKVDGKSESPPAEAPPTGNAQLAAQADTQFTIDLYRQLASENDNNLFLSGYSVMSALMLLSEGTVGPAANELGEVLHLPESAYSGDPAHPWGFSDFSNDCATLEYLMSPGDSEQTAAARRELEDLEAEWAHLRGRIEDLGESRQQYELIREEEELVDRINALRQQIDPYQLRFANAVWCEQGFPLSDEYLASVEEHWGEVVFPSDFRGNPDAEREAINDWVAEQTNDLITDLLPAGSVSDITRLILTNAVYFKGNWEEPFEPSETEEQPFLLASGEESPVMLMSHRWREAPYVELTPAGAVNDYVSVPAPPDSPYSNAWELPENPDGFKLLELPYRGGQMSMIVVLPNRPDGLAGVEALLTAESLAAWQSEMDNQHVHVAIPRFTMRNTLMLSETLEALGLSGIFQPGSLTALSDSPEAEELYVGLVIQQAFIEVNEEGTEAAAATAIIADAASAFEPEAPKPTPEFRADHPFLYYIQDRETGAIVFMGRMTTPE